MKSKVHQKIAAPSKFRFKKYDNIGNPSAESDESFLLSCFVNNGELDILRNCADQHGIIVGRTGAGKTALLRMLLDKEERAIEIEPQNLALGYISDSNVLKFFEALDVKMDLFYRLLWRHVFVVEILMRHFGIDSEAKKLSVLHNLRYTLQGKQVYIDAFEYLNQFGSTFWLTTESRVKEVTQTMETGLTAGVSASIRSLMKFGAEGARKLTEEERYEVTHHGHSVINSVQMSKLGNLFEALDQKILTDSKKRYFLVIDRLDEDWVEDEVRYRLIKALIETMREVNRKIRHAKIVIALRIDLLDRVLAATSDAGFQDEKYRALCLPLSWSRLALAEVLELRINQLVQHQYSGQPVRHSDLLPQTVGPDKERALEYMLDRTLLRPRDVITFFNICLGHAVGEPKVKPQQLLAAEGEYSQARLRSLSDEWSVHYPNLLTLCRLLQRRSASFHVGDIADHKLHELCLDILVQEPAKVGEDFRQLQAFYDGKIKAPALRAFIAFVLHRVGLVGLKTSSHGQVAWSYLGQETVSLAEVDERTSAQVHKMFWRALGINPS